MHQRMTLAYDSVHYERECKEVKETDKESTALLTGAKRLEQSM